MIPVTVLMPVFNGERYLSASIQSVLNQSFADFELLVVDDGSTDASASLVESFEDRRVRMVRNSGNLGLVATLNRGLEAASGTFIARLDADDLMAPARLAEQLAFLRGNPTVPVLGSDARLIDADGRWCGRWRTAGGSDWIRWECGFRTPFAHSSVMFRREVILGRFGGYKNCRACEDLDLWGRVAAEFPVVSLSAPLVSYRIHRDSVMAAENARATNERVQAEFEILYRNQQVLSPGCDPVSCRRLAAVWSGMTTRVDWTDYFADLHDLRLGFLRGRPAPGAFLKVLVDEQYMLACRLGASERKAFLSALWKWDRATFLKLPWGRLGWRMLRG